MTTEYPGSIIEKAAISPFLRLSRTSPQPYQHMLRFAVTGALICAGTFVMLWK